MGKLKNSTLYNSINEKALTFRPKGSTNTVNTRLELDDTDTVTDQIDAAGLESEQSAADKLSFMMQMLTAAICSIESKLTELTYNVVCHAEGFAAPFTAFVGVSTVVPYHVLKYAPTDGSFLDGEFTAGRSGYYDVSAYFDNNLIVAPANANLWLLIGGSFDSCDVGHCQITAEQLYLQGSRVVYCEAGSKISASIRHDAGVDIDLNPADYPASGYISISYSARQNAATI